MARHTGLWPQVRKQTSRATSRGSSLWRTLTSIRNFHPLTDTWMWIRRSKIITDQRIIDPNNPESIRACYKIPNDAWDKLIFKQWFTFNYYPQISDLLDDKANYPGLGPRKPDLCRGRSESRRSSKTSNGATDQTDLGNFVETPTSTYRTFMQKLKNQADCQHCGLSYNWWQRNENWK